MAGEMINIGCGTIYHPSWINLDIAPDHPDVIPADITRGLPLPNSSAMACYSSHVLEHMDQAAARSLLAECLRVLESGGVLRLAVPDLEAIVREYLIILEQLTAGESDRARDYDWIMLEMYDQVARNHPGGEMAAYLDRLEPAARGYVVSRIGSEAERIWDPTTRSQRVSRKSFLRSICEQFGLFRLRLAGCLVKLVAGRSASISFAKGVFRDSGEVHQWMYDRYSLSRLLQEVGFTDILICGAQESRIEGFASYELDTLDGKVRKPDSLFIEAIKP